VPVDSIQTQVRLNWTVSSFYSSGGTTQFADRMAAVLGIKASNIKIVSVYEGSVIIQFLVVDSPSSPLEKVGGLTTLATTMTTVLTSSSVNLGAPVLSVNIVSVNAS
jgi:hypothetical protein